MWYLWHDNTPCKKNMFCSNPVQNTFSGLEPCQKTWIITTWATLQVSTKRAKQYFCHVYAEAHEGKGKKAAQAETTYCLWVSHATDPTTWAQTIFHVAIITINTFTIRIKYVVQSWNLLVGRPSFACFTFRKFSAYFSFSVVVVRMYVVLTSNFVKFLLFSAIHKMCGTS